MDKETETTINRLLADNKAAHDLNNYLTKENKRLRRDVEEANARAYVMAKEVTLWQSRAALKEGE